MKMSQITRNIIKDMDAEQTPLVKAQPVNPPTGFEETEMGILQARISYVKSIKTKVLKLNALYNRSKLLEELGPAAICLLEELDALEEQNDNKGISNKDLYGYWVTVNPPYEDKDTEEVARSLLQSIEKLAKKKGIFSMQWVMEQSGKKEEDMGKHPHAHILIQRNNTNQSGESTKLKKSIKSSFKKFGNQLDIKSVSITNFQGRERYIRGQKTDTDKNSALKIDQKWRKTLMFKPFYLYPEMIEK